MGSVFARAAGILCHVTSLPGGRLGDETLRFLDFLAAAGQRWWQVLPFHPPGIYESPYAAVSAFAGHAGLVPRGPAPDPDAVRAFRRTHRRWLDDYALFAAVKAARGGVAWTRWSRGVRDRDPASLARARRTHAAAIERIVAGQYRFEQAWLAAKRAANERGIGLMGDIPIFVAHDSADVWAHRDQFKLTRTGAPQVVTGVPPDYFSADGQRWGNPHYRWDVMRRRRYSWWIARMRRMFELCDAVRIDHFLGFVRAWEIPARAKTGRRGTWAPGPGAGLLTALQRALGDRPLVAEDLGIVTPEAVALREQFRMPGMRVLHFSFGGDPWSRPFSFPRNCVVYTGTHDNDTTMGWLRHGGADAQRALRYAGGTKRTFHWDLLRVAWTNPADLAIAPAQDLLGLGRRARMNTPGTIGGNWRWRLRKGQLDARLAKKLRTLTEDAGR